MWYNTFAIFQRIDLLPLRILGGIFASVEADVITHEHSRSAELDGSKEQNEDKGDRRFSMHGLRFNSLVFFVIMNVMIPA